MNKQLLKQFGKIKPIKPQDLKKPKTSQDFDFAKIAKLSHKIAKTEYEKKNHSE